MKISVVMPIYNMEKYLYRSLDALTNQSYKDYELILVNDGSTDSSESICMQYKNKYPELIKIINKENGGLSSARNRGMEAAIGEFVVFPDPDDWVERYYLEMFAMLQEQYAADMVCVGYSVDYEDG